MIPSDVVMAFVAAVNGRDLDRMKSLMTEDHAFVDSLDNRVQGRDAMIEAWRGYFAIVPDYQVCVERLLEKGEDVALFGKAAGTHAPGSILDPKNRWEIPAAWLAEVRQERISVWRVFADNFPMRRLIGGEPRSPE